MAQDTIGGWAANSASAESAGTIKVIRREQPKRSRGQIIMSVADKIFPTLMAYLKDKRDVSGMLFQPAHVRGMALNAAEILVKRAQEQK